MRFNIVNPMIISMYNHKIGEKVDIKVGFSWLFCIFSCFYGLPLFFKKLYGLGSFLLALTTIHLFLNIFIPIVGVYTVVSYVLLQFIIIQSIIIFLMIYLGFKGNELIAKNYLSLDYEFVDEKSELVQYAKQKWKIYN